MFGYGIPSVTFGKLILLTQGKVSEAFPIKICNGNASYQQFPNTLRL